MTATLAKGGTARGGGDTGRNCTWTLPHTQTAARPLLTQVAITDDALAAKTLNIAPGIVTRFLCSDTTDDVVAAMSACSAEGSFTVDAQGILTSFSPSGQPAPTPTPTPEADVMQR